VRQIPPAPDQAGNHAGAPNEKIDSKDLQDHFARAAEIILLRLAYLDWREFRLSKRQTQLSSAFAALGSSELKFLVYKPGKLILGCTYEMLTRSPGNSRFLKHDRLPESRHDNGTMERMLGSHEMKNPGVSAGALWKLLAYIRPAFPRAIVHYALEQTMTSDATDEAIPDG
jgi:hypothetical protein